MGFMSRLTEMQFEPPAGWLRLRTIDAHTAGEPLRVITGGYPELPGETILAKRRYAREHLDHLRRVLMLEPRGHADMYGCILTEPVTPDGDVGVLFLHNEGYSTMCGHGIIGLVKVGVETGRLSVVPRDPVVRIDTPAGRVTATAHMMGERVERVSFRNVPSFLLERDLEVDVEGLGRIRCAIGYGGAFYAYVDADVAGVVVTPSEFTRIVDVGMRMGTGPIFSRNVCVFADGEVDRSPTGTGVSGRAAVLHARGELGAGETITIESLIGTSFDVRVADTTTVGDVPAIIPEVSGAAHITGCHEFFVDPEDPLREGVLLR
jgi:trans-L-3-hydroxyproline dehydratase